LRQRRWEETERWNYSRASWSKATEYYKIYEQATVDIIWTGEAVEGDVVERGDAEADGWS
jgi:hypothetical protein